MTDGLRALPTIRATCAAVALLVRLRPTGAATMRVEQSCKKLRRDTPLFCRCAAIVSFSPVFMDSLRGNVRPELESGRWSPRTRNQHGCGAGKLRATTCFISPGFRILTERKCRRD